VIALFFPNQYYPSREAYLAAIADAMQSEYEAIAQAGIILQVDCPDLAMGRHIQFTMPAWRSSAVRRNSMWRR
jgi:5-methyltetrahydropteroyltriglutamate--homocysteine methyltransferase